MTDSTKTARPSVDFSGVMTRTVNEDKHVQYVLRAFVPNPTNEEPNGMTERVLTVNLRADEKDKWVADFPAMRGTNRSSDPVLTKGYATEKAGDRKPVFDHVMIALGRQLATFADDCDSLTVSKTRSVAALTDENARLKAQLRAMGIITGTDEIPLTNEERGMLTPDLLTLVDAKLGTPKDEKKTGS